MYVYDVGVRIYIYLARTAAKMIMIVAMQEQNDETTILRNIEDMTPLVVVVSIRAAITIVPKPHTGICTCMYKHKCTHTHLCMNTCITCMYTCVYVYMCVVCMYACMYVSVYVCMHASMQACVCMYVGTRIKVYILV